MLTLYNVVSADGYIARKDGSEDFIPDSCWPYTLAVLGQYDCILLGRKTYETIQGYDAELRESFDALPMRKVVVTKDSNFNAKSGYEIVHTPEEVIESNLNIVATSGPSLNQYLIDSGLVDKITFHEVPATIGGGIRPYSDTGSIEPQKLDIGE